MQEEWKDIPGWEGIYQVSTLGRVRSVDHIQYAGVHGGKVQNNHIKSKIKKQRVNRDYYEFTVSDTATGRHTMMKTHRAVALAFIPNPDNRPQVNHIDGNKLNNRVDNLEWVTIQENVLHRYRVLKKNRTGRERRVRCIETGEIFESLTEAAKAKGTMYCVIWHSIRKNERIGYNRYKAGGYHWEFI